MDGRAYSTVIFHQQTEHYVELTRKCQESRNYPTYRIRFDGRRSVYSVIDDKTIWLLFYYAWSCQRRTTNFSLRTSIKALAAEFGDRFHPAIFAVNRKVCCPTADRQQTPATGTLRCQPRLSSDLHRQKLPRA